MNPEDEVARMDKTVACMLSYISLPPSWGKSCDLDLGRSG